MRRGSGFAAGHRPKCSTSPKEDTHGSIMGHSSPGHGPFIDAPQENGSRMWYRIIRNGPRRNGHASIMARLAREESNRLWGKRLEDRIRFYSESGESNFRSGTLQRGLTRGEFFPLPKHTTRIDSANPSPSTASV